MKKSDTIWGLVAVGAILLAVVAVFLFIKDKPEKPDPKADLVKEYQEVLPDSTEQEILDMLNKQVSDETVDAVNEANNGIVVDPERIIEYLPDGFVYLDENGEKQTVVMPSIDMTPEEIDEYYDNMLKGTEDTPQQPNQQPQQQTEVPTGTDAYDPNYTPYDGEDEVTGDGQMSKEQYAADGTKIDMSLWDLDKSEFTPPQDTTPSSYTMG